LKTKLNCKTIPIIKKGRFIKRIMKKMQNMN